jgi:hypothetical protein
MRRQRLNRLSPAERAELNRQLKDAVEAGLIRPSYSEFGSLILFVRKADGSLSMCIDYRGHRRQEARGLRGGCMTLYMYSLLIRFVIFHRKDVPCDDVATAM